MPVNVYFMFLVGRRVAIDVSFHLLSHMIMFGSTNLVTTFKLTILIPQYAFYPPSDLLTIFQFYTVIGCSCTVVFS